MENRIGSTRGKGCGRARRKPDSMTMRGKVVMLRGAVLGVRIILDRSDIISQAGTSDGHALRHQPWTGPPPVKTQTVKPSNPEGLKAQNRPSNPEALKPKTPEKP